MLSPTTAICWSESNSASLHQTQGASDALAVSRQVMSNQLACLRGCGLVEACARWSTDLVSTRGLTPRPCLGRAAARCPLRRARLLRRRELHLRMTTTASRIADNRRQVLQRRIRWIVTATIAYNLIEAVVAIAAGTVASSAALIGFGLDSTIEVLSAAAVAWQFTRRDPERWEKGTLRVIAVAFSPSPRTSPSRPCSLSSTKWTSSTPLSVSSSPPSASSSCRSSRSRSVAPVASWDRPRPDTPYRRRGRRTGRGL
jgi:hypothetical protein